jgi:hypothetical protein
MEQEDYLKRQIDQLGRVLGKILSDLCGSKTRGMISSGIEAASHDLKTELDMDINTLVSIPTSKLIDTLQQRKEPKPLNTQYLRLFSQTRNDPRTAAGKVRRYIDNRTQYA